jgi:hypothetical protein
VSPLRAAAVIAVTGALGLVLAVLVVALALR